ncbi:hypothetical protein [Pontibacter beigongshangensis]|uniref:hypothetical protein n=1 Tax=Pontibacter beigongshangensis TaxID=2574733 RepID=UPI00164F5865|nr:hypothetical protein [Pontibacter beigongshangensis]
MRAILTFLAFTIAAFAHGQHISWGLAGRVGVVATNTSAEKPIYARVSGTDYDYKPGLQVGAGVWAAIPAGNRGALQFMLQPTVSRQHAGEIHVLDQNRNSMADAKSVNFSVATGISGVYLHHLSSQVAVGAGVGAHLLLFTKTKVYLDGALFYGGKDVIESYDNHTYRRLPVYLPLELQVKLTEKLALVGQFQVGVSNRLAAAETAFKERDLALQIGLNYSMR